MSQLTPSTDPLGDTIDPGSPPPESQSWSALAIAGFVLSLVGCLGITAILGLIFGVAGIAKTRGGRRRGFRLAVAAIPISIVTGAAGLGVVYTGITLNKVVIDRKNAVVGVLRSTPDEAADAVATLRKGCSKDFIDKVSDESLITWVASIRQKHGSLISIGENPTPLQDGTLAFKLDAKFVNGSAPIVVRLVPVSATDLRIDYIDVDGLAPGQSP